MHLVLRREAKHVISDRVQGNVDDWRRRRSREHTVLFRKRFI
jgi:hypothetical protein